MGAFSKAVEPEVGSKVAEICKPPLAIFVKNITALAGCPEHTVHRGVVHPTFEMDNKMKVE